VNSCAEEDKATQYSATWARLSSHIDPDRDRATRNNRQIMALTCVAQGSQDGPANLYHNPRPRHQSASHRQQASLGTCRPSGQ